MFLAISKPDLCRVLMNGSNKMESAEETKQNRWKGMIILVFLGGCFLLFQMFNSGKRSFKEVLDKTAEELNKTCPLMADDDMRLDNAVSLPGNVFQYNYTFISMLADSVDAELLEFSIKPAMINNARKNPDLELFRTNKVSLVYNFKDRLGNFLMKIRVKPEDYLNTPITSP